MFSPNRTEMNALAQAVALVRGLDTTVPEWRSVTGADLDDVSRALEARINSIVMENSVPRPF